MCAIAGVLNLEVNSNTCKEMLKTMLRRGPDGNGIYSDGVCTLLHARLAIVDPDGGKQPMQYKWGGITYTIVYNGELYNTDEVRNELIKLGYGFQSYSDTEVVLCAFIQWAELALQKLNGIFAFAVWNDADKKLFLARDRLGVKPLFYTCVNRGLIFASEIKTILQYPVVERKIDSEGIAQIILLGPGRKPGSGVFHNIFEIEPGCCAWYEKGTLKKHRYWKLCDRIHTDSFKITVQTVRDLVIDSITRQMVSDVPIGTFLSGGLDSSIITAVCSAEYRKKGRSLKSFSLYFQDNEKYFQPGKFQPSSDNDYIQIMEDYLKTEPVHTILQTESLLDELEDATRARDLPGMADVDFSLSAFCGQIRQDVKVALSGECADEIFGGYPWYRDPSIRSIDGFPWAQNIQQRASLLSPWVRDILDTNEFVYSAYRQTIDAADILPENSPDERRMKEMVNLNVNWFMQTLLDRKDRMSMYHGLEVRVPFCDYRIAEYLYAVPWEFKDYNNCEKGLLRCAMEGILPDKILWRKKSPYPKTYDPKYLQLVAKRYDKMVNDCYSPIHQIVDKKALKALFDGVWGTPWYGQLMQLPQTMAYMLQINTWLKEYNIKVI